MIRSLFVQGVVTRQLLGIEGEYDAARKKSSRQEDGHEAPENARRE